MNHESKVKYLNYRHQDDDDDNLVSSFCFFAAMVKSKWCRKNNLRTSKHILREKCSQKNEKIKPNAISNISSRSLGVGFVSIIQISNILKEKNQEKEFFFQQIYLYNNINRGEKSDEWGDKSKWHRNKLNLRRIGHDLQSKRKNLWFK